MNPLSPIETDLLTGFAVAVAYLLAFGGVAYVAGLLAWHALEWRAARRNRPDPAPPITVTTRTAGGVHTATARVTHLVVVPPAPHRPWVDDALMDMLEIEDVRRDGWRCPQGMRVVRGGKGVGR